MFWNSKINIVIFLALTLPSTLASSKCSELLKKLMGIQKFEQEQLIKLIEKFKPKSTTYRKNAPIYVYKVESANLDDLPSVIKDNLGKLDKAIYRNEYLSKRIQPGNVIILQFRRDGTPDFYPVGAQTLKKKFEFVVRDDALKEVAKTVNSLTKTIEDQAVIDDLQVIKSTKPQNMIRLSDLGISTRNKVTIHSHYGEQTKPRGQDAYLSLHPREKKWYLINADESGFPMGWRPIPTR
jgi:hypothetical protein